MKLDYFNLLSPEPLYIINVGHIKSPKLKEISNIGYENYSGYLSMLLLTSENYYKGFELNNYDWYKSLNDNEKEQIILYDLITHNEKSIYLFLDTFNFFFVENIVFNIKDNTFHLYDKKEEKDKLIGVINSQNFSDVCDLILQRNNIFKNLVNEDFKKAKNKRALEILKKLKKGQEKQNKDKHLDERLQLSNIISAVAAFHNSLNMVNIWDITVYQLYDQFDRLKYNTVFNIESTTTSVWGNKENKFDITKWYQLMGN